MLAPNWRRLLRSSWKAPERDDPLTYAERVSLASYHPDQNLAWREHELYARDNYREQASHHYDLGGEG